MKIHSPFEIAKLEMAKGVKEIKGSEDNERILLYGCAVNTDITDDEVPWCSAFMNFCVIMSNLTRNFSLQEVNLWMNLSERKCQLLLQDFFNEHPEFKALDKSIDNGTKLIFPTYSAAAISWENHTPKSEYEQGAILVKKRGFSNDWKRHVCFVDKDMQDGVLCLGGNQGDKIGVSIYNKSDVTFLGKI